MARGTAITHHTEESEHPVTTRRAATDGQAASLLAAITGSGNWQNRAACGGCPNPDAFFPDGHSQLSKRAADEAIAAYCARCPVTAECDAQEDRWGIWGGVSRAISLANLGEPCGTVTAYYRHMRYLETPCAECRAAYEAKFAANRSRHHRRGRARSARVAS